MHMSCTDEMPRICFVSLANLDVLVSKEKPIIAEESNKFVAEISATRDNWLDESTLIKFY